MVKVYRINKIFIITMVCFFCLFLLFMGIKSSSLFANSKMSKDQKNKFLDKKIDELKIMKRGYEARAIDHENQGQRLQFINSELKMAKKHWVIAEKNRQIAVEIQKDIESFEEKKDMVQDGKETDVFASLTN